MPLKNSSPINPAALRIDRSSIPRTAAAKASIFMNLGNAVKAGIQKSKEKREKKAKDEATAKFLGDFTKQMGIEMDPKDYKNVDQDVILKGLGAISQLNQQEKQMKEAARIAEIENRRAARKAAMDARVAAQSIAESKAQIQMKEDALEAEERESLALNKAQDSAISNGQFDSEKYFETYKNQGGRDFKEAAAIAERMANLFPGSQEINSYTIGNGKEQFVVLVDANGELKNSAYVGGDDGTAHQKDFAHTQSEIKKAKDLYKQGDISAAHDILFALDVKTLHGVKLKESDVPSFFGDVTAGPALTTP